LLRLETDLQRALGRGLGASRDELEYPLPRDR
jgi:hypothetical protein